MMKKSTRLIIIAMVAVLSYGVAASAQFQMPDPKQMSGIPRPVNDLPAGTVSVRLIRGALSNNIKGHPVELRVGDKVQTAKTDENGRAEFRGLPSGAKLQAVAVVDGERLESEAFSAPSQGGIRLMLVATDKDVVPGETYTLRLEDGRSGELRIDSFAPDDSDKVRALFVGQGPMK